MKHAYLVVEGPQDVEMVGRLLKPHRFERVRKFAQLESFWHDLVPRTYPHQGELGGHVPVPTFFVSPAVSVAVHSAGSDSRIVPRIEETLTIRFPAPLDGIGALLDADAEKSPVERFTAVRTGLLKLEETIGVKLEVPEQPGQISATSPCCGIFVLPDNQSAGTLEDLLLECARVQYPGLLHAAQVFVDGIKVDDAAFFPEDMREFRKPAGRHKATLASVSSVLKPGRTLQVSLQDNRWLEGATLTLPRVAAVQRFLVGLLGIS